MPDMMPPNNDSESSEASGKNFSWWQRLLFVLAGAHLEIMKRSPPPDHADARAIGLLVILNWLYLVALYTTLASILLENGHFNLLILAFCMFLATYVGAMDVYMFNYAAHHKSGIRELKKGGLDLTGGVSETLKSSGYLAGRLVLSLGLASLSGLGGALIWYEVDIAAQIDATTRSNNAGLTREMTSVVDADIKRLSESRTRQEEHVKGIADQVNALRQTEIDAAASDPQISEAEHELEQFVAQRAKAQDELAAAESFETSELGGIVSAPGNSGQAGAGPRYRAAMQRVDDAKAHAQEIENEISAARQRLDVLQRKLNAANRAKQHNADERLPSFEKALAVEQGKLQSLTAELARLAAHRNAAIEERVRTAPSYVPRSEGMLARLKALESIANEDSKAGYTILALELVAFGLELAFVMCKVFAYVPTTYSALLAADHYRRIVRIVNEVTAETNQPPANDNGPDVQASSDAANDNQPNGHAATGTDGLGLANGTEQPPKRKRGRPKGSRNVKGPNGSQGNSGTSPEPQK